MNHLTAINTAAFSQRQQELMLKGWRVEWDTEQQANVCYDPAGEMMFAYGREENEHWGAWAYLVHLLEDV